MMKRKYINLAAMLLLSLTFGCKKAEIRTIDQIIDSSTPQIKFFNFAVNGPSVNFFGNGNKIGGVVSATGSEATTGIAYGGVFPASNYSALSAGSYTFKAQIPSTATTDANLAIATVTGNLAANKYYSLYTSGLYNTTAKTSDAFIVEDALPAVDNTQAYIRLVNTVPNATAGISLYAKSTATGGTETLISTSTEYKTGSAFVAIPAGNYELYGRYASTPTTNLIVRNGTSVVGLVAGKVYTITAKGDATIATTGTAANRISFDFLANR